MSSFDDRKDAFERKFSHDQEKRFKIEARCCKLLGLWIADKLGLEGDDADTYAKSVVVANLEEPGFEDVKRKVSGDLQDKNISVDDETLYTKFEEFLQEAEKAILAE